MLLHSGQPDRGLAFDIEAHEPRTIKRLDAITHCPSGRHGA
jgi:hypothetical protein